MLITPVLVTCNSEAVISSALASLQDLPQMEPCIVVDNASSDKTVAIIQESFPKVRLLRQQQNLGFARANNVALREVKTPYVLFINPDAMVQGDALQRVVEVLQNHPSAAAAAPILAGGGMASAASVRPVFDAKEALQLSATDEDGVIAARFLSGALAVWRMDALREIGFFDEAFFLFYEDDDLCLRAASAGYDLLLVANVDMAHSPGNSSAMSDAVHRLKLSALTWSELYMHKKHIGAEAALRLAEEKITTAKQGLEALPQMPQEAHQILSKMAETVEKALLEGLKQLQCMLWTRIQETHALHPALVEIEERLRKDDQALRSEEWGEIGELFYPHIDIDWAAQKHAFDVLLAEHKKKLIQLRDDVFAQTGGVQQEQQAEYDAVMKRYAQLEKQLEHVSAYDETYPLFAEWKELEERRQNLWNRAEADCMGQIEPCHTAYATAWSEFSDAVGELWMQAIGSCTAADEDEREELIASLEQLHDATQNKLHALHQNAQRKKKEAVESLPLRLQEANAEVQEAHARLWQRRHEQMDGIWSYTHECYVRRRAFESVIAGAQHFLKNDQRHEPFHDA